METASGPVLDRAFRALADETRRRLWRLLAERPGASTAELVAEFPHLSRWAVMKHLAVLRDADLVQSLPEGRQRRHFRSDRGLIPVRDWLREAD